MCKVIDRETFRVQRFCEALSTDTPLTTLWTEVVAFSDAWSRHQELDRELFRQAKSVGFTDERWRAIKDGS